jgi:chromosome partitioning protein
VDCDPQANATSGLGVSPTGLETSIYDLFMSRFEGFPEVSIRDLVVRTASGIDLVPSTLDLVGAEPYLYQSEGRATVLRDALDEISPNYDMVLIDTPPSMGQFVINGLVAADHTIVNLDPGIFALEGIETMNAIFQDIRENIGGDVRAEIAIMSQESPVQGQRAGLLDAILGLLSQREKRIEPEAIDERVSASFMMVETVPFSPEVPAAQRKGLPISHYAPDCPAGQAYRKIASTVGHWKK